MYLHCNTGIVVVKKHNDESYANWAKENRVKNWERIYESYHPKEKERRRLQSLKAFNEKRHRNKPGFHYK